ncbi:DUF72 domain-containing protein [Diaphorobacter sp. MNS-0]|uniref:DUF72 domain-containing protein n=1 Tax=Diaphorobacter sp. MNS-0 TaxID=2866628 RepID=UPI001C735962|nr:DUF72 domain-containing protein [Diaphorobacter sp. MNS-0]QYY24268.1 DUF72 domain-containing protein [Diaphorobacter sp. MNS-0]
MQDDLFGGAPPSPSASPSAPPRPPEDTPARPREKSPTRRTGVHPAAWGDDLHALANRLPPTLRLGTSSWSYPGWQGLVWEGAHSEQLLARKGLPVLAQHPLMRTVSIDRSFYRPLTASDYARYAAQVPADFRFVVKAPSLVTDALVRSEDGRGREPNPAFLDAQLTAQEFVAPALEGLGQRTGALVFQLSPLPWNLLDRLPEVLERLRTLLQAQPALCPTAPDAVLAVEVRDPEWLAPAHLPHFADVLRSSGATYCLGLHARLSPLAEQLPLLRLLWPGPLVCRWNLNPVHGPQGYEAAEKGYAPYDRIHDPDPDNLALLARTVAGICGRGQNAFVTISNHAEGCAPLTAQRLAEQVVFYDQKHL